MAVAQSVHRVELELSDNDRSVYAKVELRIARHPSETAAYLATRLLAYALRYDESLEFGAGLSTTDAPALMRKDPTGQLLEWIDIGTPTAERMHRASKLCALTIFTHHAPELLLREARRERIHQAESILAIALPSDVVNGIAERLERVIRLEITVSEDVLYVNVNGTHLTGELVRLQLGGWC